MKKFFSLLLVIININCFAQANKWFVSLSTGSTIGGPSASLKKQIIDQHFDQTSEFSFFGLEFSTKYPIVTKDAALLLRGGYKLNDRKGLYFVAGRSAKGSVQGFKNEGNSGFWLIGGSYGQNIEIDYTTYQLTAGYLYSFPNTRFKAGFGPSLFLLSYSTTENYFNKQSHSALVPGATGTARIPLGKEKKLFGVELVFEGNAAVPVKMKGDFKESGFKPGNVNMLSANIGLAFSFRR
ncbi:MAG: hypothetical protein ACXVBH_12895 [Flavisolibacter sp.]